MLHNDGKTSNNDNKIKLKSKAAGKYSVFFLLIMLSIAFMLGFTYSVLSTSKTATGSITFALTNSPEMSLNINYVIDSNNRTYLGTTQGAQITNATDVLRINI